MRFAVLLAAVVGFWVQPAVGQVWRDVTLTDQDQRWDFAIIGALPPNTVINLPHFNQYWRYTKTWTSGGVAKNSWDQDDLVKPFLTETVLSSTPTTWSILYDWDESAIFDRCDTAPAVIGDVCATSFEVWANFSWEPYSQTGEFLPVAYDLTMTPVDLSSPVPEPAMWLLFVIGIGLLGLRMRAMDTTSRAVVGSGYGEHL